ncbi:methylitaconate delta2-delta3-isomerase [Streptomyces viridosporus ATCC 14672]|uniref:Methylitaconate delta2-delta3-isomerase n=1 Tax=Streptomyces viridosporus (strain ATCC 14672 / DSM 40746 / JCM 4963 / KCTC 9882 / NRRL B-12104 / FH 1290) TaxID=566461 RepID=D6A7E9_STRV1|nr:methylitaconate delta2-delta3-isomerase [Streptomyces viridosporus ATCC 14672]
MSAEAALRTRPVRRHGSQTAIPCLFMRGGTSRGPFFDGRLLPGDTGTRDAVLLAAMGSPDPRQIDGVGGGHPLTSKVGIVRPGTEPGVDVEWTFAQVQPAGGAVDTSSNCGNMLAAVLPFAVETGMVVPVADRTTARVLTKQHRNGRRDHRRHPRPDPTAHGTSPTRVRPGSTASPTPPPRSRSASWTPPAPSPAPCSPPALTRDTVEVPGVGPVDVTLIDNGQPLVIVAAERLGATGHETPAEIDADEALRARVEALRLVCGEAMGLGDVTERNYPKMTLVAPPRHGGTLTTRSLIPRVCHQSIGVLAAVTAATACVLDGSVARDVAAGVSGTEPTVSVEHPSGAFAVTLGLDPDDPRRVVRSALLRTARLLMAGDLLVPRSVWDPVPASQENA